MKLKAMTTVKKIMMTVMRVMVQEMTTTALQPSKDCLMKRMNERGWKVWRVTIGLCKRNLHGRPLKQHFMRQTKGEINWG